MNTSVGSAYTAGGIIGENNFSEISEKYDGMEYRFMADASMPDILPESGEVPVVQQKTII